MSTTARIIVARYPGRCPACNGAIVPGQSVVFFPRLARATVHRACDRAASAVGAATDLAVDEIRAAMRG